MAETLSAQNRGWDGPDESLMGPPDLVVERIAPYLELRLPLRVLRPSGALDTETLERLMAEVKPRLAERSGSLVSQGR